jgi:BlaI family transcriptional regulator, penicillinase repressor
MSHRPFDRLGALQRAVMEIVWRAGEATVQQVRDRLPGKKRPAYTTVLSVMQKLERAGWLRHREAGRAYVYQPVRSRQEEGKRTLRNFVEQVFSGDRLLLFEHLLDDELSLEELSALKKMIDQRRQEARRG